MTSKVYFGLSAPHDFLKSPQQVAFLRKAWSQARCALLGLQEPQVEEPFLFPVVLGFWLGISSWLWCVLVSQI